MDVSNIIAEIDAKITSLQHARAVLVGLDGDAPVAAKAKRGRPKGSTNAVKAAPAAKPAKSVKRKRNLSPEGRARIAEAMKKRWAARRGTATKAVKK